jgi:hypothetical protein
VGPHREIFFTYVLEARQQEGELLLGTLARIVFLIEAQDFEELELDIEVPSPSLVLEPSKTNGPQALRVVDVTLRFLVVIGSFVTALH